MIHLHYKYLFELVRYSVAATTFGVLSFAHESFNKYIIYYITELNIFEIMYRLQSIIHEIMTPSTQT